MAGVGEVAITRPKRAERMEIKVQHYELDTKNVNNTASISDMR